MDISYLGSGCVKLSGRQVNIVCDPYDAPAGLGKLKTSTDVVLSTRGDIKPSGLGGMTIDGPGEYEVKGAMITGIPVRLHVDEAASGERGTMYSVLIDGFNVAFLGNIAPELSDKQVEDLGQVDVLVVPVGGHGLTLDAQAAAQLASRLEPKFVVPTHFADDDTKYPMPQDEVAKFMSEMGVSGEPVNRLKLNSKELPPEMTVVVLQRAGAAA